MDAPVVVSTSSLVVWSPWNFSIHDKSSGSKNMMVKASNVAKKSQSSSLNDVPRPVVVDTD